MLAQDVHELQACALANIMRHEHGRLTGRNDRCAERRRDAETPLAGPPAWGPSLALAGVSPTLARRVAISRMLPNIRVTLLRLASRLNQRRRWWCKRHYAVRMKLFSARRGGGSNWRLKVDGGPGVFPISHTKPASDICAFQDRHVHRVINHIHDAQPSTAINTANVEVIVTKQYDGVIDMAHLIRLGMPNA